jgi:hypothetical protein
VILLIHAVGRFGFVFAAAAVQPPTAPHAFPPAFAMPPELRPDLEAMAQEWDSDLTTATEFERRFLKIIRTLAETRQRIRNDLTTLFRIRAPLRDAQRIAESVAGRQFQNYMISLE